MLLETLAHPLVKLKSTNFTDASFATRKSTLTEPTGDGIIDVSSGGSTAQNAILFRFFGTDANNENFNCRILGWEKENSTGSWEYILLAQFAVTLGNLAGTASCAITATDFEADTIALTYGNDDVSVSIVSPANDVRGAYAVLDFSGMRKVEVLFDMNSSAASGNCLWKKL